MCYPAARMKPVTVSITANETEVVQPKFMEHRLPVCPLTKLGASPSGKLFILDSAFLRF